MTPIEMTALQPLPAPVWFILFFKILGFILHALLMNLWLATLPLALILHWQGGPQARLWGSRLIRQMPIFITFGVNFGIVPLLFIQLLYPQTFYPATILMAWHWLAIIVLLIPAYYGVYLYAYAVRRDPENVPALRRAAGWLASLFFVCIGFFFVNGLTLTAQPELWRELWLSQETAGAATGFGSAIQQLAIWPRFGMMIALGLGTTAVWTLCDRNLFLRVREKSGPETDAYVCWSSRFACACALAGLLLFVVCALLFAHFLQKGPETAVWPSAGSVWSPVGHAWLVGPALLLIVVWNFARKTSAGSALAVLGTQVVSLTVFACVRQWLQCRQLSAFLPLDQFAVRSELGPMVLFLGLFGVGVLVLAWMVTVAVSAVQPPEIKRFREEESLPENN